MRAGLDNRAIAMSIELRTVALLFSLMCGACVATVETLDDTELRVTSDAFRDYAERVFRDQNRMVSALAFKMEDGGLDPGIRGSLEDAEARVLAACRDLNEIATRQRDRQRRRPLAEMRAARTVPECERAVDTVARTFADLL